MKKVLFLCFLATGLGVYSLASALPVNDLKRSAATFQRPFQQKLMQKIAEAKKKSSSHSHHHKKKCFFHLLSLGTMHSTFLVNDTPQIDITAEVCVKDERVSLTKKIIVESGPGFFMRYA